MPRLLLVRHGQSEWNADGRWQGQADPPLSDLGRLQARAAGATVGAVDAIVASPLERAHHTAMAISESVGVGPVLVLDDLMERHAGEWQGLTRTQIEAQYPGYLDERVLRAIATILTELDGADDVVAVTHGGVIYALERHLGADFQRIPNLGARFVSVDATGRMALGERLLLVDPDEVLVTSPDQI